MPGTPNIMVLCTFDIFKDYHKRRFEVLNILDLLKSGRAA